MLWQQDKIPWFGAENFPRLPAGKMKIILPIFQTQMTSWRENISFFSSVFFQAFFSKTYFSVEVVSGGQKKSLFLSSSKGTRKPVFFATISNMVIFFLVWVPYLRQKF